MKLRFLAAATLAALTLTAGLASAQDTASEKGKLSYALGYQLAREAIETGSVHLVGDAALLDRFVEVFRIVEPVASA